MEKKTEAVRGASAYDVSAIVLTYHSDFAKLRQTLLSLIFQRDVNLQIVVADDGSPEDHRDRLVELFAQQGFTDYKLVMNEQNRGTIFNFLSGLDAADGEYSKAISPGDFLAGSDVLSNWLRYTKEKGCDWSFSEIVNYTMRDGAETLASEVAQPVYIEPYVSENKTRTRWNYVVLDDVAPGCAFFARTQLMKRYADELAAAGNRFAEDFMFRMMMFDGICGCYYPAVTVFYEYGTGISTGKNKAWADRLFGEYLRMHELLAKRENLDALQKKMLKYSKRKTSAFAMIFVPGKLRRFLKLHIHPRKYPVSLSESEEWRGKCR